MKEDHGSDVGWRFFVRRDGRLESRNGRRHVWPEPTHGKPGAWVRHEGHVELCSAGLHDSPTIFGALRVRQGYILARVEVREIVAVSEDKRVSREMRVAQLYDDQRYLVGLATLAASNVLPIFEAGRPGDARPRECIMTLVRWLGGAAPSGEISAAMAAAEAAAWAAKVAAWAAEDAAEAAAWAAARAAEAAATVAAKATEWAAWAAWAAEAAAGAAARAAADAADHAKWEASFESQARAMLALAPEKIGAWLAARTSS